MLSIYDCRLIDLFVYYLKNTQNRSFLYFPAQYDFFNIYEDNYSNIDKNIILKYGSRKFARFLFDEEKQLEHEVNDEDYKAFRDAVYGAIVSNGENYQKAYNVLVADYNPLNNYDKTSNISEAHKGTTLDKSGTETDTLTKSGKETDIFTKSGTETNTLVKSGNEKLSKVVAKQNETTNNEVSPENSENYFNTEKETKIIDAHTDTDTQSFENRTDANTLQFANRQDTNEKTYASRVDTNVKEYNNIHESIDFSITTTEKTSGNIGTLTSTTMMYDEYVKRMQINFLNNIIKDVLFEVTY